jgi:hypothetical protein
MGYGLYGYEKTGYKGGENLNYIRTGGRARNTGLFISPSETSELSCTTTKTDTAERNISIGAEFLQVFLLGSISYLQVSPLGGSHDETWSGQGIRKRFVS